MGSEGPSAVTVHVTGFKKFHGVAENPTEKIVCNLKSFMEKTGLPKGLVLGNCTVLEAAGQSAHGPLYEFLESTIADRDHGSQNQQVILTTLPVEDITKSLRQMGYDVMLSEDAGRFVCNYVYYHSLRFAVNHNIKSLFVHFPLFAAIDEEVQMHFVASLIEVVTSLNL